jgi:hypothetical protein
MSRYTTLVTILDQICSEAPPDFKRYHPSETKREEVGHARSRAFIHLFLKVRFGLTHFKEREQFLTDDPQDGGIDGYFLDEEHKTIYLIQSKFRSSEINFKEKEILFSELLQMDVDRVVDGEKQTKKAFPTTRRSGRCKTLSVRFQTSQGGNMKLQYSQMFPAKLAPVT